ncbi:MAG: hypothetical protein LBJ31_07985 [Treponema sp.]|jgi:hypothetical protein|nr:hypothetical protein [Treponema sp.]
MRKNKPSVWLLLSFAAALQTGCAATQPASVSSAPRPGKPNNAESFFTEPHYISPEIYQRLRAGGVNLLGLGADRSILDVSGKIRNIRSICGIRAASFAIANMPEDMARILKKYQTNDEFVDYYNYVVASTQRVVLCPEILLDGYNTSGNIAYGITLVGVDPIYPDESTIYVNTLYRMQHKDTIARLISNIVHETSHRLLIRLVAAGELPQIYLSLAYNERYAYIRQEAFLKNAARDPEFYSVRDLLQWHIDLTERRINSYNLQLGLPAADRALLPRLGEHEGAV